MIVFVHLLNDRSGSPRVLRNVMAALVNRDPERLLYLGDGGEGFLGDAVPTARRYAYRRGANRWATLMAYLGSQWALWRSLRGARDIRPDAWVYVNTLLPFAAGLWGRLSGRRVVYHLHEVSLRPRLLQWFLLGVARCTAHRLICVSEFHRRRLGLAQARVVYNSLDPEMFSAGMACAYAPRRDGVFRVCMLCSLRDYKGVPEFLRLAQDVPAAEFVLAVSDGADAVQHYFADRPLPTNFRVLQGVADTADIYAQASLVVNLSRVDLWQETFGLTLLEAMAFGVPVIAPPVGGPTELVEEGVHGYLIDSREPDALRATVVRLAGDAALCEALSQRCRERAASLSPAAFEAAIRQAVFAE